MRVIYVYEHCPAAIRAQMEQDEAMDVHVQTLGWRRSLHWMTFSLVLQTG